MTKCSHHVVNHLLPQCRRGLCEELPWQTLTGTPMEAADTVGRVLDQMMSLEFSFQLSMGQLDDLGQVPEGHCLVKAKMC